MSTSYVSDYARAVQRQIIWDETRSTAAGLLAIGYSQTATAEEVGVHRNTIRNWLDDPEFAAEVDRLSVMTGVASRAERIRIANRLVRQRVNENGDILSDKDVLDWLKFAQSETDGAKLDFSKLAELLSGEQTQQDVVSSGSSNKQLMDQSVIETTATTSDSPDGPSTSSSSQSDELDFNPS